VNVAALPAVIIISVLPKCSSRLRRGRGLIGKNPSTLTTSAPAAGFCVNFFGLARAPKRGVASPALAVLSWFFRKPHKARGLEKKPRQPRAPPKSYIYFVN